MGAESKEADDVVGKPINWLVNPAPNQSSGHQGDHEGEEVGGAQDIPEPVAFNSVKEQGYSQRQCHRHRNRQDHEIKGIFNRMPEG